jgi:hypothetical protein
VSTSLDEIIAADLNGELAWEAFDIPGGSAPVSVCRLHADPATRAVTAVVRFPAGWERAEAGSYEAAEEFHVLEGSVELNGEHHGPGTWVRVPAHVERLHTATPGGALTLARFDGPPRWHPTRSTP